MGGDFYDFFQPDETHQVILVADASDEEIIQFIKSAVDEFAGEVPQFDDMTMLSFSFLGRK